MEEEGNGAMDDGRAKKSVANRAQETASTSINGSGVDGLSSRGTLTLYSGQEGVQGRMYHSLLGT